LLERLDEIAVALGHANFREFRAHLGRAAVLLKNLAECASVIGAMSDDDIRQLVEGLPSAGREWALRTLTDLQAHLPSVNKDIVDGLQKLMPAKIGRPYSIEDRESKRKAINDVLANIAKGYSEAQAKAAVAAGLGISRPTMNQIWKNRAVLTTELSAAEILSRLITILSEKPLILSRSTETT
jgi:hypothetical protein